MLSLPNIMEKNISYDPPTKNTLLWIFVSYKPHKGDKARYGKGKICANFWCFIQNLQYPMKILQFRSSLI